MDVPWPLVSEDNDWFAFQPTLTPAQVANELLLNFADWLLDEMVYVTEDDRCVVRLSHYRALRSLITKGALRPAEGENEPGDWFYECEADDPRAVSEAWVVKL